jgi:hypothetical protein
VRCLGLCYFIIPRETSSSQDSTHHHGLGLHVSHCLQLCAVQSLVLLRVITRDENELGKGASEPGDRGVGILAEAHEVWVVDGEVPARSVHVQGICSELA